MPANNGNRPGATPQIVRLLITEVLEAVISARLPGRKCSPSRRSGPRHRGPSSTTTRSRCRYLSVSESLARRCRPQAASRRAGARARRPEGCGGLALVACLDTAWRDASGRCSCASPRKIFRSVQPKTHGARCVADLGVGSSFESALTRARPSEPSSSAGAKESRHETRSAPHFGLDRERPCARDGFLNHQQAQASSFRAFVECIRRCARLSPLIPRHCLDVEPRLVFRHVRPTVTAVPVGRYRLCRIAEQIPRHW